MGATDAAVIRPEEICVSEDLAGLCNGEYICPNYGRAAGCPPFVNGPQRFRKWQEQSRYAIVLKIELPASILFSSERKEVMRLLHKVAAQLEQKAVGMGFEQSRAFAGGSCKSLFCEDHDTCCVVENSEPCRHPDEARPSISGYGIDAVRLMETAGWPTTKTSGSDAQGWIAGLVLIG